jgi:hypothetical protein
MLSYAAEVSEVHPMAKKRLYRVQFINQGKVYELYAKRVGQASLYGFIEIEGLVFGEKSTVVVDPTEERLKAEFEGVHLTHVPIHAVIRIDEVEKQGTAKIVALTGKPEELVASHGLPSFLGQGPKKS